MSESKAIKWSSLSLISLLLVSLLGVVMRYKIGFEFPWFNQKNLQHAHSHFAFSGWVSQTLMFILFYFIRPFIEEKSKKKYHLLLGVNLLIAYGMFFSFAAHGYDALSITFSTGSILVSFVFISVFFRDLKLVPDTHPSKNWFKASLIFSFISSAGTFSLAYMMATKNIHQNEYLASVYWYLHFQYNGWFFFACMGIFQDYLLKKFPEYKANPIVFKMFAYSCIPALGLSLLWMKLAMAVWIIVFLAALFQVIAWVIFLKQLNQLSFLQQLNTKIGEKYLWMILGLALSIKLFLQLGSTIPEVSTLAFGFRPIVIAYLHLVLLGIISLFLLVVLFSENFVH